MTRRHIAFPGPLYRELERISTRAEITITDVVLGACRQMLQVQGLFPEEEILIRNRKTGHERLLLARVW